MFLPNVFAFFILKLLTWMTLAASEKLFNTISEALALLTILSASFFPQTVEFFSIKLSRQISGDLLN